MRNIASRCIAITCALLSHALHAEDLGAQGLSYAKDPDARATIRSLLERKQASGELSRFWQDFRGRNLEAIRTPASLGLATVKTPRSEWRELSFTLPSDYRDSSGAVLVKRGTVVKPLDRLPLKFAYIFIDGTDAEQVQYAVAKSKKTPLKIILTAGSPLKLREQYKNDQWLGNKTIPFYFDQRRMILNSLKTYYGIDITSVPVMLSQEDSRLRLDWGVTP